MRALWDEYEAAETNEARFVRDMNLVDMCLQALCYERDHRYDAATDYANQGGYHRLDEFFATAAPRITTALGPGRSSVEHSHGAHDVHDVQQVIKAEEDAVYAELTVPGDVPPYARGFPILRKAQYRIAQHDGILVSFIIDHCYREICPQFTEPFRGARRVYDSSLSTVHDRARVLVSAVITSWIEVGKSKMEHVLGCARLIFQHFNALGWVFLRTKVKVLIV